jgi:hypothetical protein
MVQADDLAALLNSSAHSIIAECGLDGRTDPDGTDKLAKRLIQLAPAGADVFIGRTYVRLSTSAGLESIKLALPSVVQDLLEACDDAAARRTAK